MDSKEKKPRGKRGQGCIYLPYPWRILGERGKRSQRPRSVKGYCFDLRRSAVLGNDSPGYRKWFA
jgi:hypothetical protein